MRTNRLTNTQFMALRSIAREPWTHKQDNCRFSFQWKINKKWYCLYDWKDDFLYAADGSGVRFYSGAKRWSMEAWEALESLIEIGLVEDCRTACPNSVEDIDDWHEYRLSDRGRDFLKKKANVAGIHEKIADRPETSIGGLVAKAKGWLSRF